jgi:Tol biopolymer transport system component
VGPHPVLSPDGKRLAVLLTDGATTNIWAFSISDGSMRAVTDFGRRAIFIARRVSWSADGRSIFAAVGEGDVDVVVFRGLKP